MYKTREEIKTKGELYDTNHQNLQIFDMTQQLEKLKHENLILKNDVFVSKSDCENFKLQSTQMKLSLEAKERSYNDLHIQYKDLQIQLERTRRSTYPEYSAFGYKGDMPTSYNKNFVPFFKSDVDVKTLDLYKNQQNEQDGDSKQGAGTDEVKKIKVNLSPEQEYKTKVSQEKYSSSNVGAALMWGNQNDQLQQASDDQPVSIFST